MRDSPQEEETRCAEYPPVEFLMYRQFTFEARAQLASPVRGTPRQVGLCSRRWVLTASLTDWHSADGHSG